RRVPGKNPLLSEWTVHGGSAQKQVSSQLLTVVEPDDWWLLKKPRLQRCLLAASYSHPHVRASYPRVGETLLAELHLVLGISGLSEDAKAQWPIQIATRHVDPD